MLASIHPLGERARRQRWGVTVVAYVLGTAVASAAVGAALGAVGGWVGLSHHRNAALAGVVVAGLAAMGAVLDLRLGGASVPTIHRQVNEQWLARYRGWVYGLSFGFQLGLGVVTVVSTFAVYLTLVLALMAGSIGGGLIVGAAFGVVRGATILAVARVHHPEQLQRLHRRLRVWDPVSRRLTAAVQALVAAGAVVALVTG